jgi:hypothetical protein
MSSSKYFKSSHLQTKCRRLHRDCWICICNTLLTLKTVQKTQRIQVYYQKKTPQSKLRSRLKQTEGKIQSLLHLMDAKYPSQVDKGLNGKLQRAKGNKRKSTDGSKTDAVSSFVALTFKGTLHQTLQNSDTTLYLSLQHPNEQVRLAALTSLQELLRQQDHDATVFIYLFI